MPLQGLATKTMSKIGDKSVRGSSREGAIALELSAFLEDRSQMKQRRRNCARRGRGATRVNHERRGIAVKGGVEQVDVGQHQDQHDDRERAEQNHPTKRTDFLLEHAIESYFGPCSCVN